MGHTGLPPNAIVLGLLLSHEEGSGSLDANELARWFLDSHHGAPGFIGSADTLPALRVALELAELSLGRVKRVWAYPELSVVRKGQQFMHLATMYKVLAGAEVASNGLARFALAITDSKPCLEQVWQWVGNIMGPRSSPPFMPGGLITLTFSPQGKVPHLAFQNLAYCEPLKPSDEPPAIELVTARHKFTPTKIQEG
ncbi:MAG: hypothetical protein AAB416_04225 [Patescibacteria group bacterium]